jgi:hypothetical protein
MSCERWLPGDPAPHHRFEEGQQLLHARDEGHLARLARRAKALEESPGDRTTAEGASGAMNSAVRTGARTDMPGPARLATVPANAAIPTSAAICGRLSAQVGRALSWRSGLPVREVQVTAESGGQRRGRDFLSGRNSIK